MSLSNRFCGRDSLLAALTERLDSEAALITLVGAPGVGKSRLAREALKASAADATVVCELAAARDDGAFFTALARTLRLETDGDVREAVFTALRRRRPVVLLDGVDWLTRCSESTVGALLDGAPEALLIATSRERLQLPGEEVVPVQALDVDAAVAMFDEYAAGDVSAARDVTKQLVQRLDCNPLAIELAAARVRTFSPQDLLERLDQRFALLKSRTGNLHEAIQLSWDLLDEHERAALVQVSVFRGGFDLAAAEAVVAVPPDVWCFDVIESLVDKSLLQRSGDRRFVLPESLRAFVEERSSDDAARDRHARYFAGRLEEWEGRRWDAASLDEAWMDVPNLLAAAERTVESAPQLAGRAVLAAHLVLRHRGQTAVHLDALELGLRAAPEFRAALLCARAEVGSVTGELAAAKRDADEAAQLANTDAVRSLAATMAAELNRRLGAPRDAVARLRELGRPGPWGRFVSAHLASACADVGALDEVRDILAEVAPPDDTFPAYAEGLALKRLAYAHYYLGNHQEQRRLNEDALAIAEHLGDRRRIARARQGLGDAAFARSDFAAAREAYQVALAEYRELGNDHLTGVLLGNLGAAEHRLDDLDAAAQRYREALALHRRAGATPYEAVVCFSLGVLEHERGNFDDAAFHYDRSRALSAELGLADDVVATEVAQAWSELTRGEKTAAKRRLAGVDASGSWKHVVALTLAVAGDGEADLAEIEGDDVPAVLARGLTQLLQNGAVSDVAALRRTLQGRLVPLLGSGVAAEPSAPKPDLVIGPDGNWFCAGADEVSLRRRKAHRRILAELGRRWPAGEPLDVYDAFELGWPGEEVEPEVAAERVYWVVGVLRRLGLDGVLLTLDEGYILARELAVEVHS